MNRSHSAAALFALAMLLTSGCQPGTTIDTEDGHISGGLGRSLTISAKGHPKAEITAAGDFSIGGEPVQVTEIQRTLLTSYYRELDGITAAGIAIGKQGTALAGKSAKAAIKGVLNGDTDSVAAQAEAEARKMEAEAMKICDRLTGMLSAQEALAAQLPAFAPYAGLTQKDITDCRS